VVLAIPFGATAETLASLSSLIKVTCCIHTYDVAFIHMIWLNRARVMTLTCKREKTYLQNQFPQGPFPHLRIPQHHSLCSWKRYDSDSDKSSRDVRVMTRHERVMT